MNERQKEQPFGPRYVVIGTSGSGKTTTAQRIAGLLDIPHIELDALHWEPDWQMAALDIFRRRVENAVSGPQWAADGNYSKVRDLLWPRATDLVWLDYSFLRILWRITTRTLKRTLGRQELWNGNREAFRKAFFSKDSIIWWSITTYHRRRREYPKLIARPEHAHLTLHRHRSPAETESWIADLNNRQDQRATCCF